MSQPFRRTDKDYYKGYLFTKTDKYKYISSTDRVDINSGNLNKLLLDGSNNKVSIISENIDLSSTNILIEAQEEVKIKAGTYTIDADTLNQVYDNYEITVENVQRENNSLDWVSTITGIGDEEPVNLQIDNENNVYITGTSLSNLIKINQGTLNNNNNNNNNLIFDISYDVSLNGGSNETFLIKYKQDGSLNWVSTITGNLSERPVNLQIDNSNNVYITGFISSNPITINKLRLINNHLNDDNSVSLNTSDDGVFLIKYDEDGSLNWVSTIIGDDIENPVNLQIDNNNVYMTGYSKSDQITITQLSLNNNQLNVVNSYDVSLTGLFGVTSDTFLIKYDEDGSLNWVTTITGDGSEIPVNLQIDNSNVYMTGWSLGNQIKINQLSLKNNPLNVINSYDVSLNTSVIGAFLIKYDEDGSLNWVSTIIGDDIENPVNLQIDNNNVYITGRSNSNQIKITQLSLNNSDKLVFDISYDVSLNGGNDETFLIKYDEDGSLNWVSTITGTNSEIPVNLQIDNNNVYMTGYSASDKIKITQLRLINNNLSFDISYDVSLNTNYDGAFLIKYDEDGSLNWVSTIIGTNSEEKPVNLQIDNSNVYITGRSKSNQIKITQLSLNNSDKLVFDISYDVSLNTNTNYTDAFLIKYDEDGSLNWVTTITGPSNEKPVNLQIDNSNVYMTGYSTSNQITINQLSLKNNKLNVINSYDVSLNANTNGTDAFLIKMKEYILNPDDKSSFKITNETIEMESKKFILETGCSSIILDSNDCEVLINADEKIDLTSQNINVLTQEKITLDASGCASIVLDSNNCEVVIKADENIDLSSQNINVLAQDKITLDASGCSSIVLDSNDCKVVITADEKIDLSSQNINALVQDKITLDTSDCASIILDASECEVVITADENIDLSSQNINVLAQDKITLDATGCASIILDSNDCEVVIKADEKIDLSSQKIYINADNINLTDNNISLGNLSLNSITTGQHNNCIGHKSGLLIQDGSYNNCIGSFSGAAITEGYNNNCIGRQSGFTITSGKHNNCMGSYAGFSIRGGSYNNYFGYNSTNLIPSNFNGCYNNCIGYEAGNNIADGSYNNCIGFEAGRNITTGTHNNCIGYQAGHSIEKNYGNTCIGNQAGKTITSSSDTTGINNICIGSFAGLYIGEGKDNTCIGNKSGSDASMNGAINRTAIGYDAVSDADNQVCLGNNAVTEIINTGDGNCNLGSTSHHFKNLYLGGNIATRYNNLQGQNTHTYTNTFTTYITDNPTPLGPIYETYDLSMSIISPSTLKIEARNNTDHYAVVNSTGINYIVYPPYINVFEDHYIGVTSGLDLSLNYYTQLTQLTLSYYTTRHIISLTNQWSSYEIIINNNYNKIGVSYSYKGSRIIIKYISNSPINYTNDSVY